MFFNNMKNVFFISLVFLIVYACKKTDSSTSASSVQSKISGCDSIKKGLLKTTSDTVRLISCLMISNCDSVRLGILKPNKQDTLRLLSCIKISGCDSVRLGLLNKTQDLLRLNCSIANGWMGKNLDVTTYRNGDVIPQVTDLNKWASLTSGAWCYYNNDPANNAIYGKLYNWYAVNDPRGLAPKGWHIPTDTEWTALTNLLGGESIAGGKMKTTGTSNWDSPNAGATNEIGFAGLPGGFRYFDGPFSSLGANGHWWSASERSSKIAWYRSIYHDGGTLFRAENLAGFGFSVRCLRDDNSFDY